MWVQVNQDYSMETFLAVPCSEVYAGDRQSVQFEDQIHDMMCADMRGKTIKLENSGKAKGHHGFAWLLIVDTC